MRVFLQPQRPHLLHKVLATRCSTPHASYRGCRFVHRKLARVFAESCGGLFEGFLGGFSARRISPRWLRLRAGLSRLARMGKFVAWVRRLSCFAGTPKRWRCGVVGRGRLRRGAAGLQDLLPVGYNDLASTRAATLGRSLTDAISGTGAAAVNVEVSLWVESVAVHDNRQSPTRDYPGP